MLQFGSFESKEEADARLVQLKNKHAGVIAKLDTGVREVSLPPDNLTVYRTQAGPLNTRAEAQAVCSQLASNGDECYVVETAMVASASTPAPAAAPAAPVAVAAAAPAPAETPAAAPATAATTVVAPPSIKDQLLAANQQAVAAAQSGAPAVPAAVEAPAAAAPATSAAPEASELAASGSVSAPLAPAPVQLTPIPARDSSNMATLARMSNKTTAGQQPAMQVVSSTPATPSPQLQAAMDEAEARVTAQNEAQPATKVRAERSFWSRLNPWADDEEEGEENIVVAKQENEEPMLVAEASQPAPLADTTAPAPVVAEQPVIQPMPQTAPMTVTQAAEPLRLPPPPAPLRAKDVAALKSASNAKPEPIGDLAQVQGAAPAQIPVSSSPNPPVTPAAGNVSVAEAQRVPLSEAQQVVTPVQAMQSPVQIVSLRPSATLGQKTLWAHIGRFKDAQSALQYWQSYRQSHPDFPVVRVRVTTPYAAATRGYEEVALRVGPFARNESVKNLCATITGADNSTKSCGTVIDGGVAANPYRNDGFLAGSRYKR